MEIHLELSIDGTAPTGHATLESGEERVFSGWVGLVRAVEELVAASAQAPHRLAERNAT
jgi:hypothetical protein